MQCPCGGATKSGEVGNKAMSSRLTYHTCDGCGRSSPGLLLLTRPNGQGKREERCVADGLQARREYDTLTPERADELFEAAAPRNQPTIPDVDPDADEVVTSRHLAVGSGKESSDEDGEAPHGKQGSLNKPEPADVKASSAPAEPIQPMFDF